MNLSSMFKNYILHLEIYNAPGTVEFTKSHSRHLLEYFGAYCDPSLIDEEKILSYIKFQQKNDLTHNTINKRVQLLKRLYKFHKVECKFSDVRKLKEKFVTYGAVGSQDLSDILKLVDKMSLRDRLIFYLFLDTGCRLTELLNIKIENIDFSTRSIYLEKTKTNDVRTVFYTSKTKTLLLRYCRNSCTGFLFINPKTNHKLTSSGYEQIFQRFRKKHNIKKLSPHMLRHTFSTNLYNNGADLVFISRVLGHSSVDTTKRYIHQDNKRNLKTYDKYTKKRIN